MSATHFDGFVQDSLNSDPGSDKGLDSEELFGLYTSWCLPAAADYILSSAPDLV
ncbi:hypothetical protein P4U43_08945 [Arthrobacter sp. EH-1B-1]|uniref:Uncharacterized protein n=1 Tax=Arthrobacter vasquezii TaxID=2977629 RepID=A0ABT6CV58_9MICC|nr:hypothetical protein [Arthrobacter vasquezii]MDF9277914.1 hypothetical protein [Arthrobacter vasquezii]